MTYSRRHFARLLPAVAAGAASAQQEQTKRLPSKAIKFEEMTARASGPNGANKTRAILDGETHSGFPLEVHETELPAGASPHPPHQHVNEEMFLIQDGLLDVTVNGKTSRITAGSVFYVNSNELHGVRNPGPNRARYFVVALGAKT
jgi:mannose-6-phosphate isomerase-like protein (cupin superfamily)